MCTAISVAFGDGYFGRNLDFEVDFGERIVVVPRNFKMDFGRGYAVIGMGITKDLYPLMFDGMNEYGLAMAGLRFSGNAFYRKAVEGKDNVASFDFILWVLRSCKNTSEAEKLLRNVNITDDAFSEELLPAPLHWIVADRERSLTVEQTADGFFVYNNPVGVLTNNPDFRWQMQNLANYMKLSPKEPENGFSKNLDITPYSRGMGGIGLPGDLSSVSRFVKISFLRENSVYGENEEEIVNHIFHTLYSVYQQRGCVQVGVDFEITRYTACCNLTKGIYYYTTYDNSMICGVDLKKMNVDGEKLMEFELERKQNLKVINPTN